MSALVDMYIQLSLLGSIGVVFIWMLISNHKTLTRYASELIEQKETLGQIWNKQNEILDKIYMTIQPMSFMQARDIISMMLECNRLRALEIFHDIVRLNHIHLEGHESIIIENINRELESMYQHSLNTLRRFNYSGRTLDYYFSESWEETSKVMHDELFVQKEVDEDRSRKNIKAVFDRAQNDTELKLNKA